jgi:hypothetical protein
MIAGELVRGINRRPGISLSYTYFNINKRVQYPSYLCAECHDDQNGAYAKDCPEYQFSPNFGLASNLSYPLGRGFEIAYHYEEPELSYQEEGGETTTRVVTEFYPYRTEVVYQPSLWLSGVYYDPWWYYDPFWYDPWYSCAPYYPYHPNYYSSGWSFYFSFGWNWGGCYPYYSAGTGGDVILITVIHTMAVTTIPAITVTTIVMVTPITVIPIMVTPMNTARTSGLTIQNSAIKEVDL